MTSIARTRRARRAVSQAQQPSQIDWSNSLTAGLELSVVPALGDLVGGALHTLYGGAGISERKNGRVYTSSSTTADAVAVKPGLGFYSRIVRDLTISLRIEVISFASFVNWLSVPYRAGSWSSPFNALALYANTSSADRTIFQWAVNSGGAFDSGTFSTNVIATGAGTAAHYHFVRSGTSISAYKNGVLVETVTATGNTVIDFVNQQPAVLFNSSDSSLPNGGYSGYSDGFDIWSRALSADEIASHFDNPHQMIRAPSRRLWLVAAGSGTNIMPGQGSLTLTGYAPSISQPQAVNPGAGSMAITGYAPSVSQSSATAINPGAGAITITGYAPTIVQPQTAAPGAGALSITGYAPTVTQNVTTNVNPGAGALTLTGYAPTVAQTLNQFIAPGTGSLAITGYAPTIAQPHAVAPAAGALTIAGYAPTVTQGLPTDPRYARPAIDVSAGAWLPSSGSSLYAMIDEPSADSGDYIYANSASACEIKLNPVQDPGTSSGQVVRYQVWSTTGNGIIVRLKQGATIIAVWNHASLPTDPTIFARELSPSECDSITDYANLRFEFVAQ